MRCGWSRETRCDGVMIGRAASSDPWIFRQIEQYLATGRYDEPTQRDRYEMMRQYYAMLMQYSDRDTAGKMKQFATYFTHGVRNGSQLRAAIYHEHEPAAILDLVDRFFRDGAGARAVKKVQVITDGACLGNPGPGGWAAILRYNEHKKEMWGCETHTTNNRMELTRRDRRPASACGKAARSRW